MVERTKPEALKILNLLPERIYLEGGIAFGKMIKRLRKFKEMEKEARPVLFAFYEELAEEARDQSLCLWHDGEKGEIFLERNKEALKVGLSIAVVNYGYCSPYVGLGIKEFFPYQDTRGNFFQGFDSILRWSLPDFPKIAPLIQTVEDFRHYEARYDMAYGRKILVSKDSAWCFFSLKKGELLLVDGQLLLDPRNVDELRGFLNRAQNPFKII